MLERDCDMNYISQEDIGMIDSDGEGGGAGGSWKQQDNILKRTMSKTGVPNRYVEEQFAKSAFMKGVGEWKTVSKSQK